MKPLGQISILTVLFYFKLVEIPQNRVIKSLKQHRINIHVGVDVMLIENNCTHHYNIKADWKTTLLM